MSDLDVDELQSERTRILIQLGETSFGVVIYRGADRRKLEKRLSMIETEIGKNGVSRFQALRRAHHID